MPETLLSRAASKLMDVQRELARKRHRRHLDRVYPIVDPLAVLKPGEHMRLRGCFCTWSHLDEGMLWMADNLVRDGRPLVWLTDSGWTSLVGRFMGACIDRGHFEGCRVVNVTEQFSGSGAETQPSHTIPLELGGATMPLMKAYCPDVLCSVPDVDLTGQTGGQFVMWGLPRNHCGKRVGDLAWESLDLIAAAAAERRAQGHAPFVLFVSYVTEGANGRLAAFLTRMAELDVTVVLAERIHVDESATVPATDADALFALELNGACWARADGQPVAAAVVAAQGKRPPAALYGRPEADEKRWSAHAFLVRGPKAPAITVLARPGVDGIRMDCIAFPRGEERTRVGEGIGVVTRTMTKVRVNIDVLR